MRDTPPEDSQEPAPIDSDTTWETVDLDLQDAAPWTPRYVARYRIDGLLGRGGMGVVFDAWDPVLERAVALKVLTGGAFASETNRARFHAEARAAAGLDHPALVRVLDVGQFDEQPYFTMDKVVGSNLQQRLRERGALPPMEAARLVERVARGVAAAHAAGIAHRDLKPANVLLDSQDAPRVADFGLARNLGEAPGLTRTQQVLGTPAYMAPEVARGASGAAWVPVDVFGLGAILYAALSGATPFQGDNSAQVLAASAAGEVRPLPRGGQDLPAPLSAILHKAMHIEPERRYPSAEALADDLARFLKGEPVLARPEPLSARLWRSARRRRSALLVALAAALVAAGVLTPALLRARAAAVRESTAEQARQQLMLRMQADPQQAEALLNAFVEAPEHQGTAAVAEALLGWGEARPPGLARWNGREDVDAAEPFIRALVLAPTDALRARATLGLGQWALREHQLDALTLLLEGLDAAPPPELEAELTALELRGAVFNGQLEAAKRAWTRARSLGLEEGRLFEDPGRVTEVLQGAERTGLRLQHSRVWFPALRQQRDGVEHLTLSCLERAVELQPDAEGRLQATERPLRPGEGYSAWGDLDGDGALELYAGQGRNLVRGDPAGEGFTWRDAHPGTTAANSDVEAVVVGDLEGDGAPELIVGLGAWAAYDVRVLAPDGAGGLTLRARRRGNATVSLLTLPDPWGPGELVVAVETSLYANARVFGPEAPGGPPAALRLLRMEDDALVELSSWAPSRPGLSTTLTRADLDGDGQDELLWSSRHGLHDEIVVLWLQAEEGRFTASVLPGLKLLGAMQLDEDPADELLVQQEGPPTAPAELWILGRGALPIPGRAAPAPLPSLPTPPAIQGSGLERSWQAAMQVRATGLLEPAAKAFERLAASAVASHAVEAWELAAQLWSRVNRPDRAAAAWIHTAEAAGQAGQAPRAMQAWRSAVLSSLEAADPEAALDAAARWRAGGGHPEAALADRLQAWETSRQQALRLTEIAPFHPSWRIEEPLSFQVGSQGLTLVVANTGAPLARLPLRRSGGPIAMMLELDTAEVEWGASFRVRLDGLPLQANSGGGGAINHLSASCLIPEHGDLRVTTAPKFQGPSPTRLSLKLSWEPESATWRCQAKIPRDDHARFYATEGEAPPALELLLDSEGHTGPMLLRARLARLELWGLSAGEPSQDPVHVGHLAMLNGDLSGALAQLPDGPSRAWVLARLGRLSDAISMLRALDWSLPAQRERLTVLLRVAREPLVPLLREALGARFAALYAANGVPWTSMDAPGLAEVLVTDLAGLTLDPDPEHPSWDLLQLRARMRLKLGNPDEALSWLQAYEALPAPPERLRVPAAELHRLLALHAAVEQQPSASLAHARAALALSPMPELERDLLELSPAWRALGVEP
ncbi:MAG: protein kinase [Alphaproteobacteria bacterium]|nr:protein kinase [Alphaproteobacteria bacterium]